MEQKKHLKILEKDNISALILVGIVVFFSIMVRSFWSLDNLKSIFFDQTYVFLFSIGYAFIMTSGGVDLSAGMQISVVSVVVGVLSHYDMPWYVLIAAGIFAGLLCGAVNSFMISGMRVPYSIATLSAAILFFSAAYFISKGKAYWIAPSRMRMFITKSIVLFPGDIWIVLLGFVIFAVIFNHTYMGTHMIAVGLDARSSELSNIKLNRVRSFSLIMPLSPRDLL